MDRRTFLKTGGAAVVLSGIGISSVERWVLSFLERLRQAWLFNEYGTRLCLVRRDFQRWLQSGGRFYSLMCSSGTIIT